MLKKIIKIFIICYAIVLLTLITCWSVWHIMDNGKIFPETVSKGIIEFAKFPSHIYHILSPSSTTTNIFDPRQITDTASKGGVDLYSGIKNISPSYFLISTSKSINELEFKLVKIPDGKIIKEWKLPENFESMTSYQFDVHTRFIHPLMLKDSSIITKISQNNTEKFMLFCLSKNNKINWLNNELNFHHTIELENDTTIWIPTVTKENKHFKIDGFRHDAIAALDPRNGKTKYTKSVADILVENGYQYLLEIGYEDDGIHLNDIEPAFNSSKYWEKGDLLISMRNRNAIMLYRPSTNKVLWLKSGPWVAQHDCDFVDNKTIMIFGNDVLWNNNSVLLNGHNDIYYYDFEKDTVYKPYTDMMKKLNIITKSQGRSDLLANGDMFIDETEKGKLYIVNRDSLKLIYTERLDKNHIKMFNWVRPILN